MNKRFLSVVGVLALLAWTLGGVTAWALAKEGLQITVQEGSASDQENDGMALMEDRMAALQKDLCGLAKTLGQNFARLQDNLSEESSDNQVELAARLDRLEKELTALRAERQKDQALLAKRSERITQDLEEIAKLQKKNSDLLGMSVRSIAAGPALRSSTPSVQDKRGPVAVAPSAEKTAEPAAEPAAESHATRPREESTVTQKESRKAKKKRRGFLSFDLPSQTVAFDKRQSWKLIPALSRVGFDGKSTLHDFSGVTSKLSGSLVVDLSHPDKNPQTTIQVRASMLKTGVEGRDDEMYHTLDTKKHPQITFELLSFTSKSVDAKAEKVVGVAHGKMTIRGASQEVDMPTTLSLDRSRRLHIDGEMLLDMTAYKITPPSKMGLVGMDKMVKVWIRLRARIQEARLR